jgi:hypothetical protein
MNEERDKFLTKLIGNCWHEFINGQSSHCKYCNRIIRMIDFKCYENFIDNNFSTWKGFGNLWEFCCGYEYEIEQKIGQDWWMDFLKQHQPFGYFMDLNFMDLIYPDRFADSIYKYLKERDNKLCKD